MMKIAGAHPGETSTAHRSSSALVLPQAYSLPRLGAMALLAASLLFGVSFLLPEHFAQLALDLMCWCLVGAIAAGLLFAGVRLLDGLLDL